MKTLVIIVIASLIVNAASGVEVTVPSMPKATPATPTPTPHVAVAKKSKKAEAEKKKAEAKRSKAKKAKSGAKKDAKKEKKGKRAVSKETDVATIASKPFDPTKPVRRPSTVQIAPPSASRVGAKQEAILSHPEAYFGTTYGMVTESKPTTKKRTLLHDRNGRLLAKVTPADARKARREGTIRLRDGRVLNVDGGPSWAVTKNRFGDGVADLPLIPYRSFAGDRRYFKIGQKIRVENLVGKEMPHGWGIHDGYGWVVDTGGLIIGRHIDFFVRYEKDQEYFSRFGFGNKRRAIIVRKVIDRSPSQIAKR